MNDHPIILFDGVCNYCNNMVNFVIREDKEKRFRFAALQSPAAQALVAKYSLPKKNFDSFVFIDEGKAYLSSGAALRVMRKLPWYWQWTQLFWIIPKSIRNAGYGLVAKNRYKWFGKREECMVPTADVKNRFL